MPSALPEVIAIHPTYLLPRRRPLSSPSALYQPANTLCAGAFVMMRKVPPCRRSAVINLQPRSRIRNETMGPYTHPQRRFPSPLPLYSANAQSNPNLWP